MKKTFFDTNDVGKVYLWSLIFPQILFLVFQSILMLIGGSEEAVKELLEQTPILITYLMLAQISFLIVFLFFTKDTNRKKAVKLNFKFGLKNTLICVLIGVIGIFALTPITNVFNEFLGILGYKLNESFFFEMNSIWMLLLAILLIAGVPAIVEELVFRGVVFQGLKKFGKLTAILGTSALFALVHLSAEQLIYPFIFSIILCYVVLKTNSILASMIIHFVANATSILCTYFNFEILVGVGSWIYPIAIGILAVGLLLIYLLTKGLKNTEKEKTSEEVLEEVEFIREMPAYNDNKYSLKLGITIAVVFWVVNFIYCLTSTTSLV